MLETIESVVTKRANPIVHRMNFGNLTQHESESIQDFLVRLRTLAIDCEFACPTCAANISTMHIRDQFIRGLNNVQLQTDILAKADNLKTIEDIVKHAEAFETALRDQSQFQHSADVYAARVSPYRKQKQPNFPPNKTCNGCGSKEHGIPGMPPHHSHCPAWGKTCSSCKRLNHMSVVCRQPSTASGLIVHVQYQTDNDTFTCANAIQEIQAHLTPDMNGATPVPIHIFPDSGANICLAGPKQLAQQDLTAKQLRPCNKRVKAVGGSILTCTGWLPVKFEVEGNATTQPLFICDKVDRLYFSKQGCIETHILPPHYPQPMAHSISSIPPILPTQLRPPPPKPPSHLPFPATPENVPKLEAYIREQFATTAFDNSAPFPSLSGPPAHIHLQPNAIPYARHTPIPVPHHWKAKVKESLDRYVQRGIIAPVPIGTPVTSCSPMVVVSKEDGSPRCTIDFQRLNAQCQRETHHTSTPFQLASQVPANTKKSVVDAVDGFHSVALDAESQPLTTFITEWGRFMYLRMPQGFVAAGDAYTRRYDEIIDGVERKVKIVDDTLLYDESIEQAFYHMWDYLTLCANNGVVVNAKKFKFCQDTIDFAGLTITPTGVTPSAKILSSICDFPRPTDLTSARSWFGLVNQVAWAYAVSPLMQPFRELIKPNQKFYWDDVLDTLFESSKSILIDLVKDGVQSYDISKTTCLQPDWSKDGVGYLLLQKHCQCATVSPVCCESGWKLIHAGSRFTNKAESTYAPTEGEALAVAWSLTHSRLFTLGCPNLVIATDHKPLLGILNDRALDRISNPRVQSLKEKTLPWRFTIIHCPGKWTKGLDALSRYPTTTAAALEIIRESVSEYDVMQCRDIEDASNTASTCAVEQLGCVTFDHLISAARSDDEYQALLKLISHGFPEKRNLVEPAFLRKYWEVRHRLSLFQGIALLDKRLVIPTERRNVILSNLHSANQGTTGMKFRAHQCVYWPGMDRSIQIHRENCPDCIRHAPSHHAEPLTITPSPSYPFQQVCADYFQIEGHSYLTVVDRFSGWLCIYAFHAHEVNNWTLQHVFRDLFMAYGVSEELSTDGGPQFTAEAFQQFLKLWGVDHRLSSAFYPQSNGRAEVAVKTAKRIIHNNRSPDGGLNTDKAARAILQYRNSPLPDIGLSPAQILLHRQLRDSVPAHPSHYQPHKEWILTAQARERALSKRNHLLVKNHDVEFKLNCSTINAKKSKRTTF